MTDFPDKKSLRAILRKQRRSLAPGERQQHDEAINRFAIDTALESGAKTIAAYSAFDGEPDLSVAMAELAGASCQIFVPVINATDSTPALSFHEWRPANLVTRLNVLGILEPEASNPIALGDIDLLFMPLVGWDNNGNRLGMGVGYYDRALSGLDHQQAPRRIGIAYEVQKVAALPVDSWDVPLHSIITELGRFTFEVQSSTMPAAPETPTGNPV